MDSTIAVIVSCASMMFTYIIDKENVKWKTRSFDTNYFACIQNPFGFVFFIKSYEEFDIVFICEKFISK